MAVFSDGQSAITGTPDLLPDEVLVDIGLPDISGIEIVRKLKPL